MNRVTAIKILACAVALSPVAAVGQERAGDAALGALSGALVGGPIGAVAGGVIGFTAGPKIARGWFGHHRHHAVVARRTESGHGDPHNSASADHNEGAAANKNGAVDAH
jgi:hypothetical protein